MNRTENSPHSMLYLDVGWILYISPAIYYCLDIAVGGIVYVQIDMWVMLRLQQNITRR